jgi:hypothetical protein
LSGVPPPAYQVELTESFMQRRKIYVTRFSIDFAANVARIALKRA